MRVILISDFMQDEIYLKDESRYYAPWDSVIYFSVQGHIYSNTHLEMRPGMILGEQDIFYKGVCERLLLLGKGLLSPEGRREMRMMVKERKCSLFALKSYCLFTAKAELLVTHLKKRLSELGISKDEEFVIYSYRFGIGVLAAAKLKALYPNSHIISRCHGQDLFEFRNAYNYLPYRTCLYRNVETLYCISEDGYTYAKKMYPAYADKMTVSRLGTRDCGYNDAIGNEALTLVTCSRIVPLKRLHRLAQALTHIKGVSIKWIHFGDGDEAYTQKLKRICGHMPPSVEVKFAGFTENAQLMTYYAKRPATVFVNLSESEGLPVSIMEACSVGMPVIATDVGGTGEIVHDGENGYLLKKDFTTGELLQAIRNVMLMDPETFRRMSHRSREIWKEGFSEETNYTEFVKQVQDLIIEKKWGM